MFFFCLSVFTPVQKHAVRLIGNVGLGWRKIWRPTGEKICRSAAVYIAPKSQIRPERGGWLEWFGMEATRGITISPGMNKSLFLNLMSCSHNIFTVISATVICN